MADEKLRCDKWQAGEVTMWEMLFRNSEGVTNQKNAIKETRLE